MELATEEKINEIVGQLKTYLGVHLELFRLRTIEKAVVSGSYLVMNFTLFAASSITLSF